jgi:rhamnose transport system permease protein
VAAVVIGGVAIFGGSGTVWGAALGRGPARHDQPGAADPRHPDFWQRAVVGALIIGSIVLDRVLAARRARRLVEARHPA